jgi:hypothetical protein
LLDLALFVDSIKLFALEMKLLKTAIGAARANLLTPC